MIFTLVTYCIIWCAKCFPLMNFIKVWDSFSKLLDKFTFWNYTLKCYTTIWLYQSWMITDVMTKKRTSWSEILFKQNSIHEGINIHMTSVSIKQQIFGTQTAIHDVDWFRYSCRQCPYQETFPGNPRRHRTVVASSLVMQL